MKLSRPQFSVHTNDSFKNDIFNRKEFGNLLLSIVENTENELVLSINGNWGEGKTTFTLMWQGLLAERGIPSIYFDAFACDFTDDAFTSIASTISAYIDEQKQVNFTAFKENAIKVAKFTVGLTAKIGLKIATFGIISDSNIEEVKGLEKELSKSISSAAGELIESKFNNHRDNIKLISDFKTTLSELPELLTENNLPLVIIIDELDRCRPNFALEILEKVKHFFSVKNIIFVLVMNRGQIEESIKCIYGQGIDARTYLQKFIHIETNLPKSKDTHGNIYQYSVHLQKLYKIHFKGDPHWIAHLLSALGRVNDLSLRQLETIFTNLEILHNLIKDEDPIGIPAIVLISYLKTMHPIIFKKILDRTTNYIDVHSVLNLSPGSNQDKATISLERWLAVTLAPPEFIEQHFPDKDTSEIIESLKHKRIQRLFILQHYANILNQISLNR